MPRRGRPPDPELRERLLATATASFLRHGFAASSVDVISRDAGVSKGAMFHLFPTKAALIRAALERWVAGGRSTYAAAPFLHEVDPARRALAYVEFTAMLAADPATPIGCLLGHAATELADDDDDLRRRCHLALSQWADELAALIEAARPPGAAWSSADAARHFVVVFEGAQVLARAAADREVIARHLALYHAWLRTLLRSR